MDAAAKKAPIRRQHLRRNRKAPAGLQRLSDTHPFPRSSEVRKCESCGVAAC